MNRSTKQQHTSSRVDNAAGGHTSAPHTNKNCDASSHPTKKVREPSVGWRFGVATVIAITLICLDRISKSVLQALVSNGFASTTFIPGLIDITYVQNYGAAFGIAQGYAWGFVVIAALVIGCSIAYLLRAPYVAKSEVIGLALVVGGAVGNAIDRIIHGYVIDFIATTFIDFPVFNIADIAICLGIFTAFIGFAFLSPANKHMSESNNTKKHASNNRASHRAHKKK